MTDDDDEIEKILEGLARDGQVAESRGPKGERLWRLTEQGKKYVEDLIKRSPEGRALLDKLLRSRN